MWNFMVEIHGVLALMERLKTYTLKQMVQTHMILKLIFFILALSNIFLQLL